MKLTILLFMIFHFTGVHAAALNPSKGKGIAIFGMTNYTANEQFNNDRKKKSFERNGKFAKNELNYFWSHGLNDKYALVAMGTVYAMLESSDSTTKRENSSVGDQEIGLKRHYYKDDKSVRSLQLTTSFPLYSRNANPLPGNHQHNIELRHLWDFYQTKIMDFHVFEAAYRLRLDQPADLVRLEYTTGKNFKENLIMGHAFMALSMKNHAGENVNTNPNINSDYDNLKLGASFVRRFRPQWRGQFGYLRDVWGRNIGVGHTYYLNLWYEY